MVHRIYIGGSQKTQHCSGFLLYFYGESRRLSSKPRYGKESKDAIFDAGIFKQARNRRANMTLIVN